VYHGGAAGLLPWDALKDDTRVSGHWGGDGARMREAMERTAGCLRLARVYVSKIVKFNKKILEWGFSASASK
jgi:hypothetical protein